MIWEPKKHTVVGSIVVAAAAPAPSRANTFADATSLGARTVIVTILGSGRGRVLGEQSLDATLSGSGYIECMAKSSVTENMIGSASVRRRPRSVSNQNLVLLADDLFHEALRC